MATPQHHPDTSSSCHDSHQCRRRSIGQVITNLLTNALKYSLDGAEVVVTIRSGRNSVAGGS